jgi:DNA processing protein
LLPGDARFPERLAEIPEPPRMLFASGKLDLLRQPAVAVVGSRDHTDYGLHACRLVVDAVVSGGAVVVSGMARGIDAIAQTRALDVGGSTVGILGNGFGVVYPTANRALYDRVAREGLLLSEMPPGERPRIYTFPHRNRLIAGLARLTVVVEAARTSGSLITATAALDAGREVMAVPGPITVATSEGTNALIRDGATPFTCAADIWSRLPAPPPERMALLMATAAAQPPRRLPEGLSDIERRIAAVLTESEEDLDGIVRQAGIDTGVALAELLSLELREVIESRPGRRYRLR